MISCGDATPPYLASFPDPRPVEDGERARAPHHHRRSRRRTLRRRHLFEAGHAEAAAQGGLQIAAAHHRSRRAARSAHRRHRGRLDEGLGGRTRRDPLHPLVPAAHRPHGREARFAGVSRRHGRRDLQLLGLRPDAERTRRLVIPLRRPARDVRGPRLHRVGRDLAGVPQSSWQHRHALHPDGVRFVDR